MPGTPEPTTARRRGWRRGLTAVTVAAAVAATPGGMAAAGGPASPGPVHYVALGDSRAAGPTLLSAFEPDGCGRSGLGYPARVASRLRAATVTDVTCTGATTSDVADRGQRTALPIPRMQRIQVDALRPDTTLVTLSVGGNDIGWGGLIAPCVGLSERGDNGCRRQTRLRADQDTALATLLPRVQHVLDVIHARSPRARVVLVGHGGYYGVTGCFPAATIGRADLAFVADFFRRFNGVLAAAARSRAATFVDIAGPAVGHDACAPAGRRWFAGQLPDGLTPPNHPTPLGSSAMGELIVRALRA